MSQFDRSPIHARELERAKVTVIECVRLRTERLSSFLDHQSCFSLGEDLNLEVAL